MSDEENDKAAKNPGQVTEVGGKDIESVSGGFNPQPEPPGRPEKLGRDIRAVNPSPLNPEIGSKPTGR